VGAGAKDEHHSKSSNAGAAAGLAPSVMSNESRNRSSSRSRAMASCTAPAAAQSVAEECPGSGVRTCVCVRECVWGRGGRGSFDLYFKAKHERPDKVGRFLQCANLLRLLTSLRNSTKVAGSGGQPGTAVTEHNLLVGKDWPASPNSRHTGTWLGNWVGPEPGGPWSLNAP